MLDTRREREKWRRVGSGDMREGISISVVCFGFNNLSLPARTEELTQNADVTNVKRVDLNPGLRPLAETLL
jgi:hypothetical protein